MTDYAEIDVDETPIVVLGCRHFYTSESLDGALGMKDVYEIDRFGKITGLKDISATMAPEQFPKCPDCNQPVRQYATQRYVTITYEMSPRNRRLGEQSPGSHSSILHTFF
jgi:hypothetical protein